MADIIENFLFNMSIGMTFSLIVIKLILSYLFYYKYKNNKDNKLLLGNSVLFLFLAIGRVFYVIFDYFLTRFNCNFYQQFILYWKIASFLVYFGFIILVIMSEKLIFKEKTKFIFSITTITSLIIAMLSPDFLIAQLLITFPSLITFSFIPASYIYLAAKSAGDLRKKSIFVFFGFLIYCLGLLMMGELSLNLVLILIHGNVIYIRYILHICSVFVKFGGFTFLIFGYLKN